MRISSFNLPPVEALKITRYIKLITDLGEHDSVIPEICGGCELHTPPPQACLQHDSEMWREPEFDVGPRSCSSKTGMTLII
jgi:hypothetical protein